MTTTPGTLLGSGLAALVYYVLIAIGWVRLPADQDFLRWCALGWAILWIPTSCIWARCTSEETKRKVAEMSPLLQRLWWPFPSWRKPRRAEQNGAANGSQPIRSETNRTSPAAGSRR